MKKGKYGISSGGEPPGQTDRNMVLPGRGKKTMPVYCCNLPKGIPITRFEPLKQKPVSTPVYRQKGTDFTSGPPVECIAM
jgi:hypothetical protein